MPFSSSTSDTLVVDHTSEFVDYPPDSGNHVSKRRSPSVLLTPCPWRFGSRRKAEGPRPAWHAPPRRRYIEHTTGRVMHHEKCVCLNPTRYGISSNRFGQKRGCTKISRPWYVRMLSCFIVWHPFHHGRNLRSPSYVMLAGQGLVPLWAISRITIS